MAKCVLGMALCLLTSCVSVFGNTHTYKITAQKASGSEMTYYTPGYAFNLNPNGFSIQDVNSDKSTVTYVAARKFTVERLN